MREAPISTELTIGMVEHPLTNAYWPQAKAFLHPALMRGDEDWPEVEAELASGQQQLWLVLKGGDLLAAAVTRVAKSRSGEVAEVYLVGGSDHPQWLGPLNEVIATSAKQIGCVAVRAYGREGWRKPLAALGWSVNAVAYQKAL